MVESASGTLRENGTRESEGHRCMLCQRGARRGDILQALQVRRQVAEYLAHKFPDRWDSNGWICRTCLNQERSHYVVDRLEQERGAISGVEAEVARRAGEHVTIAENIDREFQRNFTFGQRMADSVARVGGSWAFLTGFAIFLVLWIVINTWLGQHSADPFPFILLNLVLSCLAAVQAPVIMMAQNRQASRDRMQADQDYRVNLKAEIEIATLHEKVDHLLHAQWQRLMELQQIQMDLLGELASGRTRR
jgi:uncharacterized membrane protein